MTRFSLLALLAVLLVAFALAGCGGGGGGSTSGSIDRPPDPGGDTGGPDTDLPGDPFAIKLVTGKIVNQTTNVGVQNVKIVFTNKAGLGSTYYAISKADGSFQVDLRNNAVISLFDLPATFSVDTTSVKTAYPTTEKVTFNTVQYNQSSIPVPLDILQMNTGNLGYIYIKPATAGGGDDGGGDIPPPPVI